MTTVYTESMKRNRGGESGQVALAILLIMGVVLTISLAVANRTTKDIAQTIQTSSAARVFSQAESATESKLNELIVALQAGNIPVEDLDPTAEGDQIKTATSFDHVSSFTQALAAGEVAQIVMDADGAAGPLPPYLGNSINITWGEGDPSTKASIIISEYFMDGTETKSRYQFVRPACALSGDGDGFMTTACNVTEFEPVTYNYSLNIGSLLVRIQPVYHPTTLTVIGDGNDLPPQQFKITTRAVNREEDIQQNSVVEVTASHLLPPPFLDYALYSGGDLVKP